MADIDNLTTVKEVRNFLIAPVFGHNEDVRGDNSPVKFDRKHPIGIIQLINKLNYQKITEFDVEKVQAIESLIGLAIEQCTEQHSVINMRIGITKNIGALGEMVDDHLKLNRGYDEHVSRDQTHVLENKTAL